MSNAVDRLRAALSSTPVWREDVQLDDIRALLADRDSLRALLEEAKATIHEAGEQLWLLARDRKNPPLIVKECADMRDRITARLNEDRP